VTGAVEAWRRRSTEEVTLPSGMQARIRKPRVDELLRDGNLPTDLRKAVMELYSGATTLEELEPEKVMAVLDQQDRLVAGMVIELREGEEHEWEVPEPPLTVEDLRGLPPDDVEALRDIGNRTKTVEGVTARSLMQRELLSRAEGLRHEEEAKPGSIPGWKEFRDGGRGAEPGADGEGVPPVAVAAAAPRRARRSRRAGG
jgi:hypothetical protein